MDKKQIDIYAKNFKIKNVEAVLFDKDGTFQDDHIYWGKLAECRIYKIINYFDLPEKSFEPLSFAIGYNPQTCKLIKNGPVGCLSRDEVVEFMVNELKKYVVDTTFQVISDLFDEVHKEFLDNMAKYVHFIDYSEQFIRNLHNHNIKLAVVTSDSYSHTVEILKILNIDDCFELIVGKDSCDEPKKTGKPALFAIEKLNVNKSNTIVIGDAPMDFQMAKNAELNCLLVSTGQTDIDDLKKLTKNVVSNLNEVEIK